MARRECICKFAVWRKLVLACWDPYLIDRFEFHEPHQLHPKCEQVLRKGGDIQEKFL